MGRVGNWGPRLLYDNNWYAINFLIVIVSVCTQNSGWQRSWYVAVGSHVYILVMSSAILQKDSMHLSKQEVVETNSLHKNKPVSTRPFIVLISPLFSNIGKLILL